MQPAQRIRRVLGTNKDKDKLWSREIPPGTIRLDLGDPDFDTPEHIANAAREAMREGYTHYNRSAGDMQLVTAIRDGLEKDYGYPYDPQGVVITGGGAGAIYLVCAAYLSPGDEAIVFNPSFSNQGYCARIAGAEVVSVPFAEGLTLDRDALKAAISKKTKVIFYVNPSNPHGLSMAKGDVEYLAQLALEHDILLVSDECYRKFVYDGKVHQHVLCDPEVKDHVILMDSFSKTYAMTGWSIGYVATTAELAKPIAALRTAGIGKVGVPTQRAALAALQGPQDCVADMAAEYDRRRKSTLEILKDVDGFDFITPDSAFYFFGRYKADMTSSDMIDYLYQRGVAVRSGSEFGTMGEGWLRIAYSVPYENVITGIQRLADALNDL